MPFRFPTPLYPITDPTGGRSTLHLVEAMVGAGVRLLQLRIKGEPTRTFVEIARAVKAVTTRCHAQVIINDRADIAQLVDAAGVHLGQDDLPVPVARQLLGTDKIIGLSTHNIDQLESAVRTGGIDYVAVGPVFATQNKNKPDPVLGIEGIRELRQRCPLPLVAIGGITATTVPEVLGTGVDTVAVIGAIAHAVDPCWATRDLLRITAHSGKRG